MNKFFNLMYDFFSFALPGSCIVLSVLFLPVADDFIASELKPLLTSYTWPAFLIIILGGYIVGYVITPIARYFLLIKISTFLFGRFQHCCIYFLSKKNIKLKAKMERKKRNHKSLVNDLMRKNQSYKFARIRELAPKNAQYIEFWDMHSKMSHNLAFACIVFVVVLSLNSKLFMDLNIIIICIAAASFFVLLYISYHYSVWWKDDKDNAYELTKCM